MACSAQALDSNAEGRDGSQSAPTACVNVTFYWIPKNTTAALRYYGKPDPGHARNLRVRSATEAPPEPGLFLGDCRPERKQRNR